MIYSSVVGLDKKVSRLVYGTANPLLFDAVRPGAGAEEKERAFSLLDKVYENGINTFDCAAHYGEEIMGEWMDSRDCHDKCVIITKCAHPNQWRHRVTAYDILSDAHNSLVKLRTDCIDLYLLHRDNTEVAVSVIVDVMNKLHDEGKIKAYGGSNWTHQRIEEANEYAAKHSLIGFTLSSPHFGLAEQIEDPWLADAHFGNGCVTISGADNADARAWYQKTGIPVFAYSSLARGFFSGAFRSDEKEKAISILDEPGRIGYLCDSNFEKLRRCEILAQKKGVSVAQIAMAWLFHQPFEVYAILSFRTSEKLIQNINAMELELTSEEIEWMNSATE